MRRSLLLAVVLEMLFAGAIAVTPASAQEQPPPGAPPSGCDYDQRGQRYCWGGAGGSSAPATPDTFVAIAVSPKGAVGASYGPGTLQGTEQQALARCSKYGAGCTIQNWSKNMCSAYAMSPPGASGFSSGYDSESNRSAAGQKAHAECRTLRTGCKVVVDICSNDP